MDWASVPGCVEEPPEPSKYLLNDGDILISRAGSVGFSHVVEHAPPAVFASYLIRYRPEDGIVARYVGAFLESSDYWRQVAEGAAGIAISNINAKKLAAVTLPLAPTREQDRIVDEIEKQFTRLDAAVAGLKRVQASLKRYRASVLKAACEGLLVPTEAELARREGRSYETGEQLLKRFLLERRARWEADQAVKATAAGKAPRDDGWKAKYEVPVAPAEKPVWLPESWEFVRLEQASTLITKGTTPTSVGLAFTDSGIPFVKVENLNRGRIRSLGGGSFINESAHETLRRSALMPGDLLISIAGTIGRVARVEEGDTPSNTNQAVALIRGTDLGFAGLFALHMLDSTFVQQQLQGVARGGAMNNVSLQNVRDIEIPLPPLAEQHRIADEVERRLSVVEELESVIDTNVARCARLRQSILKRAFEGKLVPQDPNDEPASVLLERIRGERERGDSDPRKSRLGIKPRRSAGRHQEDR